MNPLQSETLSLWAKGKNTAEIAAILSERHRKEIPEWRIHKIIQLLDEREWRTMESAPRDGTRIEVKIPADKTIVAWQRGYLDANGSDCGCWTWVDGPEPDDWTDGVCWTANADGVSSTFPIGWRPLPKPV